MLIYCTICKSQTDSELVEVVPTKSCFMLIAICKICHTRKNKNVDKKFADSFNNGIILEQKVKRPKHEVEISELKCRIDELNSCISKLEADLKTKEELLGNLSNVI
jgi:hypothetical protein